MIHAEPRVAETPGEPAQGHVEVDDDVVTQRQFRDARFHVRPHGECVEHVAANAAELAQRVRVAALLEDVEPGFVGEDLDRDIRRNLRAKALFERRR